MNQALTWLREHGKDRGDRRAFTGLRRIAGTRGIFLLEAVIAVTILAVSMTGFAILLTRCMDASSALRRDAALRGALENRLAELTREQICSGTSRLTSSDGRIVIIQDVEQASIKDSGNDQLQSLYEVKLTAAYPGVDWPPLATMRLVYQ